MSKFLVMAAMDGEFLSRTGNVYENFQMLGYVDAADSSAAITSFFDQPQFPIEWRDVKYMWAEPLEDNPSSGHYGDYNRVFVEDLIGSARDKQQNANS